METSRDTWRPRRPEHRYHGRGYCNSNIFNILLAIKCYNLLRDFRRPAVTLGDQGDQNIDIMGRDIVIEISYNIVLAIVSAITC